MPVIIVIDPQPILRLGLMKLLSEKFTEATIRAEDYTTLQQKNREPEVCDLVLLTLNPQDYKCHYLKYVTQIFDPRFILLLNEPHAEPSLNYYSNQPLIKGLISKEASPELIKASVQLVLAGGNCFPHHHNDNTSIPKQDVTESTVLAAAAAAASMVDLHPNEAQLLGLTKRQYEVLVLLSEGYPLKTIAKRLEISLATAKSHTETIYQRLNVNSRNAAVYAAVTRGATLGWNHPHPNQHAPSFL